MTLWWLTNFARVGAEKRAIEHLCAAESWFTLTRWTTNVCRLSAEGVLRAHGADYPVRLIYPDQYPYVPPWVEPQDGAARWSKHQYGDGGPLCLELRPDNWTPAFTGADVLRSAHDLLRIENPLGDGPKGRVESAHRIGDIQSYDWGQEPVLIGAGCFDRLKNGAAEDVSALRWRAEDDVWPVLVFDAVDRAQPQHPPSFDLGTLRFELPVIVGQADVPATAPASRAQLAAVLGAEIDAFREKALVAIAVGTNEIVPFHSPDAESAYRRKWVVLPEQIGVRSGRLASDKTIAIVGLGSVGSKMAETLLRSGIHRFLLVDGDVMLPANLERHTLDWRDVGFRKAQAIMRKLHHIVPGATIEVIAANLNWQRAASTQADYVERLSKCDLIVDATGDVATGLMLGAIAAEEQKPFVSITVYEGGLGCVLARSIPEHDPPYGAGRAAYVAYCEQQDVEPPPSGQQSYDALDDTGQPVVADDAAVSIAAAHAARIVLDIIDSKVGENDRPWLLVGFRAGWLFSRHGHSIGLDVGQPLPPTAEFDDDEARAFAIALAQEARDAAKASG